MFVDIVGTTQNILIHLEFYRQVFNLLSLLYDWKIDRAGCKKLHMLHVTKTY